MTAATPGRPDAVDRGVEVVRSEERLVAGVERVASGRVRVAKRVVTEERTVTVTVRREELVVEHLPVPDVAGGAAATPGAGGDAVLTLLLSEEIPEVSVRTVPRELVRVFVDRVTESQAVTAEVALERVDVDVDTDRPGGVAGAGSTGGR